MATRLRRHLAGSVAAEEMTRQAMAPHLEVLLTPADFEKLPERDLSKTDCVVFDVLRATSSMMTALANGAAGIFPVREIKEALELRGRHPGALLAGERGGLRIPAALSGGVEFDMGNSPREFTRERVAGREIIMTTTNGTRALQACAGARRVLPAAFLNLAAVAGELRNELAECLCIICAGTYEEAAFEDTVAAGALCDLLWRHFGGGPDGISDSAQIARQIYLDAAADVPGAIAGRSRNARHLLSVAGLREDVAFCLRRDALDVVAEMRQGAVALIV